MQGSLPPHEQQKRLPRLLEQVVKAFLADEKYRQDGRFVSCCIKLVGVRVLGKFSCPKKLKLFSGLAALWLKAACSSFFLLPKLCVFVHKFLEGVLSPVAHRAPNCLHCKKGTVLVSLENSAFLLW